MKEFSAIRIRGGVSPRLVLLALPALLALLAGGCSSSPPPRLYVLAPAESLGPSGAVEALAVGVGPVTLASHLDRPQIVTRVGHELHLDELDRWAEPLREGIAGTVAENLASLLGSERVWTHPWRPSQEVQLQVAIHVLRCDLEGGEAVLVARWTVFDGAGELLAVKRSSFREPAAGVAAAAPAFSRSLAALSREVAARLVELGAE